MSKNYKYICNFIYSKIKQALGMIMDNKKNTKLFIFFDKNWKKKLRHQDLTIIIWYSLIIIFNNQLIIFQL